MKSRRQLTGYTARMQIKADIDSTNVLHLLTTEDGGISIDGVNGKISLYISDTDSTAFTFNDAVYSLELIDTGDTGDVRRLVYGEVETFNEVTT